LHCCRLCIVDEQWAACKMSFRGLLCILFCTGPQSLCCSPCNCYHSTQFKGGETNTHDARTRLKWLIVHCCCCCCWRSWKFRGHMELGVLPLTCVGGFPVCILAGSLTVFWCFFFLTFFQAPPIRLWALPVRVLDAVQSQNYWHCHATTTKILVGPEWAAVLLCVCHSDRKSLWNTRSTKFDCNSEMLSDKESKTTS
jgi:hypothetical protein